MTRILHFKSQAWQKSLRSSFRTRLSSTCAAIAASSLRATATAFRHSPRSMEFLLGRLELHLSTEARTRFASGYDGGSSHTSRLAFQISLFGSSSWQTSLSATSRASSPRQFLRRDELEVLRQKRQINDDWMAKGCASSPQIYSIHVHLSISKDTGQSKTTALWRRLVETYACKMRSSEIYKT